MNMSQRKRKVSGSSSLQADPASKKRVEKLFQKKFSYSSNSNKSLYALPSLSIARECKEWLIEETQQMKVKLNSVKDKLSDKDISLWHAHTGQMNLAGTVISELRESFKPELCTQAWCKFYEIVSTFKLIDFGNPEFNSVHLCEAPGAFITSLNHYLISHDYQGTWTWFGSTLNPYYEGNNVSQMIADDRFILHSLPHWDFGADGTGNLMEWDNFQQLVSTCQEMAPIHLVTCDGSIDCQDTPGDQEAVVSRLHCCEALAAMTLLSPGGALVLKKFTMFECETVCLMYLLNCAFDQVEVFKPATSKSGNSEVYVIGTGFHGTDMIASFTDYIQHYFQNEAVQMLFSRENIPESFISEHVACCEMFTSLQRETICNNLDHYPSVSEQYILWLEIMRDYCAELYITKFDLKQIAVNCRIGHSYKKKRLSHSAQSFKNDCTLHDHKRRSGTFTDRHNSYALPWQQRVHHLDRYNVKPPKIIWCQFETLLGDMDGEDCSCEKPVSCLINSRFCDGKLIQQMQELIQNARDYRNSIHAPALRSVSHALDSLIHDSEESKDSEGERSEVTDERSDYTVVLLNDISPSSDIDTWEDPHISKILHMGLSSVKSPDEENNIIFYVDITTDRYCGEMEIMSQCTMLSWVQTLLKKLRMTDSLIIRMSTCLTRFAAGLIYMMGHSFSKVGFLQDKDGTRLEQLLICDEYTGSPVRVLQQLDVVQEKMEDIKRENILQPYTIDPDHEPNVQNVMESSAESQSTTEDKQEKNNSKSKKTLMETVPLTILLQDSLFVASLCHSNATLLRTFVRVVGDRERDRYPLETQPNQLQ